MIIHWCISLMPPWKTLEIKVRGDEEVGSLILAKLVFLGYCASRLGIFRALKSKSEYFLGFFENVSYEHTYHFYIKSAPPRNRTYVCIK